MAKLMLTALAKAHDVASFDCGVAPLNDWFRTTARQHDKSGTSRTYVLIEFIIDKEGKPAYARVLQGGNEVLNNKLELAFESMPTWTPAMKNGKPTAIRLKQSLAIER